MTEKDKILKALAEVESMEELKTLVEKEPKCKSDKALIFAVFQATERLVGK